MDGRVQEKQGKVKKLADIFNILSHERRERRIPDRLTKQALQPPFHQLLEKRRAIEPHLQLKPIAAAHYPDDGRGIFAFRK